MLDGCTFLEGLLGRQGFTERIKEGSSSPKEIKKELFELDYSSLLVEAKDHSSTSLAAEIGESTNWLKIWDLALDYGRRGTSAIQSLFRVMTRPVFGSAPCTLCDDTFQETYLHHYLSSHLPASQPGMTENDIKDVLKMENPDISNIIRLFHMSTLRRMQ